jgi:hypothetical protein
VALPNDTFVIVKKPAFEQRVLSLWMTTRVPLTRANLQFLTGVGRTRLQRWLDEMVAEGLLDIDSDEHGEALWSVCGAERSKDGPTQAAEVHKLERLRGEVDRAARGLAAPLVPSLPASRSGDKSVLASGALSFVLGPLGWLYAAPLKEALPAICIYFLICAIFPHFLLAPLLGIINPLSALAGVGYALRHNQRGERTPLLGGGDRPALPPRR